MVTKQYGLIHVALAIGVIVLAFLCRSRGDRSKFRWLFLTGHAALGSALIVVGFGNVWIIGAVFALWFPVAGYFAIQERKERKKIKQGQRTAASGGNED
jgi:hypothetical protein